MKATHRLKTDHNTSYFDVSTESDRDGWFVAKRIDGDYWHYGFVREKEIEPIPAPAPRRPLDPESWRALWKQHRDALALRRKGSDHLIPAPVFSDTSIAGVSWKGAFENHEYSTDFGDTWHEMSRP